MVEKITPLIVCGKEIGTNEAWDEVGDYQLHFYKTKLNDLGRKLLPDYEKFAKTRDIDLQFSVEHGFLAVDNVSGISIPIKVDWSALN